MKISDYFQKFYVDKGITKLVGINSKAGIAKIFFDKILMVDALLLPEEDSEYRKWVDGKREPKAAIWSEVLKHENSNLLERELSRILVPLYLNDLAYLFQIEHESNVAVDKDSLAHALSKQFYEIAKGNGESANNVAPLHYKPHPILLLYYAASAFNKYRLVEMPFLEEQEQRVLTDVYVCSIISNQNSASTRLRRGAAKSFENATLDELRSYSSKIVLIGNGGMGKSMLMKKLLIDSLSHHNETGNVPILVQLRDFYSGGKSIMDYLAEEVRYFDKKFTEQILLKLMERGKCQILLDGIDEIDPSDESAFKNQLMEMVDNYPGNQFVLASRDCEMTEAATGFAKLYLQPFNDNQKIELIDKLLTSPEEEPTKSDIKKFLQNRFIKEHCVFATNPMLLTFVVAKHPIIKTFDGKQSLFYKTIYETIIYGHDKSKPNYSRIFHSAKDGEEFTTAFREFCALTYMDNIKEFDSFAFEKYFKGIKSKAMFENPHKFTKNNFLRDACATSCMLYEQRQKLFYIDEGFQALLFAEYMMLGEVDDINNIGTALSRKKDSDLDSLKAFDYFSEMDNEKMEKCIFLPYLDLIFKNNDEEKSFSVFLEKCYSSIRYSTVDSIMNDKWKDTAELSDREYPLNSSTNVIYTLLLNRLELTGDFILDCFPDNIDYPELRKITIFGEIIENKEKKQIKTAGYPDTEYFVKHATPDKYLFEGDKPSVIGYEYEFNTHEILCEKEKYSQIINLLCNGTQELRNCYKGLKEYHASLSKKYAQ